MASYCVKKIRHVDYYFMQIPLISTFNSFKPSSITKRESLKPVYSQREKLFLVNEREGNTTKCGTTKNSRKQKKMNGFTTRGR